MPQKHLNFRYLRPFITQDLNEKMVFLGGPRQVGKTTLALSLLDPPTLKNPAYLNWDYLKDRAKIISGELPPHQKIVILDEIHKFSKWRNLVKGFYDKLKDEISFIVTGSARLDYYRRGGDSLLGRYHYFRLHPLSLLEISSSPSREDLEHLLHFGGFPEPFFKGSDRTLRLWQMERIERVIRDDLRDLENVRDLSLMSMLVEALPACVGSPLSIRNLREDLDVAHETVAKWLTILENLYVCYRIPPFGAPKIRAVKKEQKLYLWDHAQVDVEGGYRFENLVANQLLKYCHFLQDTEGYKMELRYLRDVDGREIDFVVIKDKHPVFAVECKSGERKISSSIRYFSKRTKIPRFFQVHLGSKDFIDSETGARVLPFVTFCKETNMP